MPNLSRYPTPIQMEFVRPHVKRGDYYLFMNPHTGRRTWVHPRKMGEDRYAVVSALGTDSVTAPSIDVEGWVRSLSQFNPASLTNELTSARADLAQARTLTKIAIGASVVASVLTLVFLWKQR
jgi:hypothetical protein